MRTLIIALLFALLFALPLTVAAQDFDAPSLDLVWPVWGNYQPNNNARLKQNAGPYPAYPYRQEFYTSASSNVIGAAVMTWTNNNLLNTVTGALVNPSMRMMNLPAWWARGIVGDSVKIGLFDVSYDTAHEHEAYAGRVVAYPGDAGSFSTHTSQSIGSTIANPPNGNGAMGAAPGAAIYFARYGGEADNAARVAWMKAAGVRIIVFNYYALPTGPFYDALVDFIDSGRNALVMGAGNNYGGADDYINPASSLPYAVCVAGQAGGGVSVIPDSLICSNVLAYPDAPGTHIDFALPVITIGANMLSSAPGTMPPGAPGDGRNLYSESFGTSFNNTQVAGAMAVLAQRYPSLPARCWYFMLKLHGRQFVDSKSGLMMTTPVMP